MSTTPESDWASFQSLKISPWRQFNELEVDLSARMTVLTGSNGSGKTTLLSLLASHFNWEPKIVSSRLRETSGATQYMSGVIDAPRDMYGNSHSAIGQLSYTNGVTTEIWVPESNSPEFSISYPNKQEVQGVFLNSHRNYSSYRPIKSIPTSFGPPEELFDSYIMESSKRYIGTWTEKTPLMVMKESLLAAAIYGEGNQSVTPNPEAAAVWNGFQRTLSFLLPKELGFEKLIADPPDIILITKTGDFPIDALSGGLSAIFELTWQIFLRSRNAETFTVCFDEPENHLHPALQRAILPGLLKAFPTVKFLVATHSPFVVNSVTDAKVFVLRPGENDRFDISLLDQKNMGLSAEDTLRDVLGVGSTLPIWAEERFNEILNAYAGRAPDVEAFKDMRASLEDAGLGSELPLAVERAVAISSKES